jgi:hypothetical protein
MDDHTRLHLLHSDDRVAQERLRRGELVRVTHGVAVDGDAWNRSSVRERARTELEAVMTAVGEWRVLSHRSAALLWGLPDVDQPDARVHVTDPLLGTTHSGRRVVRHAAHLGADDVVTVDGRRTTTLVRTVVDIARSTSFENVVAVLDHLLRERLCDVDALRRAFDAWPTARGMARARRALEFADALAESPGESVSRVRLDQDGFPPPVLQQQLGRYRVDFWWPRSGLVGEFDGLGKYEGGTDAIRAEKTRESTLLLRPDVRRVVRWGWAEVRTPGRLQALLRAAGLPTGA